MECERHPGKEAVGKCLECGASICPDCVRETGQVLRCPSCHEREVAGIAARMNTAADRAPRARKPAREPRPPRQKKEKAAKGRGEGGPDLAGPPPEVVVTQAAPAVRAAPAAGGRRAPAELPVMGEAPQVMPAPPAEGQFPYQEPPAVVGDYGDTEASLPDQALTRREGRARQDRPPREPRQKKEKAARERKPPGEKKGKPPGQRKARRGEDIFPGIAAGERFVPAPPGEPAMPAPGAVSAEAPGVIGTEDVGQAALSSSERQPTAFAAVPTADMGELAEEGFEPGVHARAAGRREKQAPAPRQKREKAEKALREKKPRKAAKEKKPRARGEEDIPAVYAEVPVTPDVTTVQPPVMPAVEQPDMIHPGQVLEPDAYRSAPEGVGGKKGRKHRQPRQPREKPPKPEKPAKAEKPPKAGKAPRPSGGKRPRKPRRGEEPVGPPPGRLEAGGAPVSQEAYEHQAPPAYYPEAEGAAAPLSPAPDSKRKDRKEKPKRQREKRAKAEKRPRAQKPPKAAKEKRPRKGGGGPVVTAPPPPAAPAQLQPPPAVGYEPVGYQPAETPAVPAAPLEQAGPGEYEAQAGYREAPPTFAEQPAPEPPQDYAQQFEPPPAAFDQVPSYEEPGVAAPPAAEVPPAFDAPPAFTAPPPVSGESAGAPPAFPGGREEGFEQPQPAAGFEEAGMAAEAVEETAPWDIDAIITQSPPEAPTGPAQAAFEPPSLAEQPPVFTEPPLAPEPLAPEPLAQEQAQPPMYEPTPGGPAPDREPIAFEGDGMMEQVRPDSMSADDYKLPPEYQGLIGERAPEHETPPVSGSVEEPGRGPAGIEWPTETGQAQPPPQWEDQVADWGTATGSTAARQATPAGETAEDAAAEPPSAYREPGPPEIAAQAPQEAPTPPFEPLPPAEPPVMEFEPPAAEPLPPPPFAGGTGLPAGPVDSTVAPEPEPDIDSFFFEDDVGRKREKGDPDSFWE